MTGDQPPGRSLPRGRCPVCGRVITGRPAGPGWVDLRPHNDSRTTRHPRVCLSRGGYRRVERLPDDDPGELGRGHPDLAARRRRHRV